MTNILVVARYQEDVSWLDGLHAGWEPLIVTKGVDVPNEGREGASFAWALQHLYDHDGLIACVQGSPFDHCPYLMADLDLPVDSFQWLGDPSYLADGDGCPWHPGLPVRQKHEEWACGEWVGQVWFAAGGQFIVTGETVRKRPVGFYKTLQEEACIGQTPWTLERLWEGIFDGEQAVLRCRARHEATR